MLQRVTINDDGKEFFTMLGRMCDNLSLPTIRGRTWSCGQLVRVMTVARLPSGQRRIETDGTRVTKNDWHPS